MSRAAKNKGFTLLEVILVMAILLIFLIGSVMVLFSMQQMWASGSSGASSNMYASVAMNRLVMEIQEGNSASVVNGRLVVVFPYKDPSTGDYDRTRTGVTCQFYLSGRTGSESDGTYLWKSSPSGKVRIGNNIETFNCTVPSPKLVYITIVGRDDIGGATNPNMIYQSVKLRNS